ncbi:MAG: cupredoxin family copper-binding protein [Acetobacteraceae bacterium]
MTTIPEPVRLGRRRLLRRVVALAWLMPLGARASVSVEKAEVSIDNFSFSPATLRVAPGTKVSWVNHDDTPHSIVCPALTLKSPALDTDESFATTFERIGTYDYICGLHPHMRGQVIVAA